DSGYPNLSWLLTPVRNARTRSEERYSEALGRTRWIIERTFGLLKARIQCLHLWQTFLGVLLTQEGLPDSSGMLHNLALRRHVPFLQEEEAGDARVAAVDPEDSEDDDEDNITSAIRQYLTPSDTQ
ncbi:hypothetical protein NDU88_003259, partial [Pleurodeles waltl]